MWFLNTDTDSNVVRLFCTLKLKGGEVLKDVMVDNSILGFVSFENHLPKSLDHVMLPFFGWNKVKAHKFATDISQYTLSTDCFKRQHPEYKEPMEGFEVWVSGVGRVMGQTIQDMLRYKKRPRDASLFCVLATSHIKDLTDSMVKVFKDTLPHMRETLLCFTLKYCKITRYCIPEEVDELCLVPFSETEKSEEDKNYGYNKSLAETMMMFILDTARRGRTWTQSNFKDVADPGFLSTKMIKLSWDNLAKEKGIARPTYRPFRFAQKFVKAYFFGSCKFIYFTD
jgi:hypothetical protein